MFAGVLVPIAAGAFGGLVVPAAVAANMRFLEGGLYAGIVAFGTWVAFNVFAAGHLADSASPLIRSVGRTWLAVFFYTSPYQALLFTWALFKVTVILGGDMFHIPFNNTPMVEGARDQMLVQVAQITGLSGLMYGIFGVYVMFGADHGGVRLLGLLYTAVIATSITVLIAAPAQVEQWADRISVRYFYWMAHAAWLVLGVLAWQIYMMSSPGGLYGPDTPPPAQTQSNTSR